MLQNVSDIADWLQLYGVNHYTIVQNSEGCAVVNARQDVLLRNCSSIEVQFGVVKGFYMCEGNHLTSLLGSPHTVAGSFHCNNNMLETLWGGPVSVGGHYDCSHNLLKSLKYAPSHIKGDLQCHHNEIESLIDAPRVVEKNLWMSHNLLQNLEGDLERVGGVMLLSQNRITRLSGMPKFTIAAFFQDNPLDVGSMYSYEELSILSEQHRLQYSIDCPEVRGKYKL